MPGSPPPTDDGDDGPPARLRIDVNLPDGDLDAVTTAVRQLEEAGCDAVLSSEAKHNPFLPLAAVAASTTRIGLGTSIAVAFARNPMDIAVVADDLQRYSHGRFMLGLGSQVQAHVERRFSMPWGDPIGRMTDMLDAIRAIWHAFATGERLRHEGPYYSHTLLTPFFSPGPNPFGNPPILLAAVGPAMCELAGATCDGIYLHPFTSVASLRERTLPALHKGLARSGRSRADVELALPVFVATGEDEASLAAAVRGVRERLAFYATTREYAPVLELHDRAELHHELRELVRSDRPGRWQEMGDLIDDELLAHFAVIAAPEQVGRALADRYGGVLDRISLYTPYDIDPAVVATVVAHAGSNLVGA